MREKASAMSSALVRLCGFWRLLRREVIGVYWEDCCRVEVMMSRPIVGIYCAPNQRSEMMHVSAHLPGLRPDAHSGKWTRSTPIIILFH